jgi:signal transduction histidine kinase
MAGRIESDYDARRRAFVDGILFRFVSSALVELIIFATALASDAPLSRFIPIMLIGPPYATVNALFWYIGRHRHFPLKDFFVHWFVDLVVISTFLCMLGGLDVPYGPFVYSQIVITSAIFMSRRGSYLVASAATFCLIGMALGVRFHVFTPPGGMWSHHYSPAGELTVVVSAVVFFFLNAYLAGTLSDQLKIAKGQIEDQNRLLEQRVRERTRELEARTLQLQERKDELEELVHIVTHDLQNVAVASAETARKLVEVDGAQFSARGQRYVDRLQRDCRLMATMLRNLLEVVNQTEIADRREVVDVASVVQECVARAQGAVEAKGINIVIGDLPLLHADEQKIHHVFDNLLSNACKYVGDKEVPRIEVGGYETSSSTEYYVRDNGIGIEPSQIGRIFTFYHRAPNQTVAGVVQQGHGIGLAVVKRIVQRYGGRMWVDSVVGEGSTFRLSFPRSPMQGKHEVEEEEARDSA